MPVSLRLTDVVRGTIERYGMLAPGDGVVVAVSGGPDSLALLHLLWSLREAFGLSLHVAHLNHLLRGEAARADAAFVRETAERLGLPVTVEEVPVADLARAEGLSLEEAGRAARYRFFRRVCAAAGARRVALGHTRDDQAETVLMRLLRGAGPAGLAGIPPVRDGWVIRPLIAVPRAAVEAYCREQGLEPRRDASNESTAFLRNRIRLDLLPRLEALFHPELRASLARTAEILRAEDEWLEAQAEEALSGLCRTEGDRLVLSVDGIERLPLALRRRVVRLAAERAGVAAGALAFDHVERVLALAVGRTGRGVSLPGGREARRDQDGIVLGTGPAGAVAFRYEWPVPGSLDVPEAGVRLTADLLEGPPQPAGPAGYGGDGREVAVLDADRVPLVLTVRSRLPGDRLRPAGLGGEKKLQDLFVDAKVPRRRRDRVPVVVAGDRVAWVVGQRVDSRAAAGPRTTRRLILRARNIF